MTAPRAPGLRRPRLRVPIVMLVGGAAVSLAALVRQGGAAALTCGVVTVAAAAGYYVLGGRDSDVGAVVGGHTDERQLSTATVASAASGTAALVCAFVCWVVAQCAGGPAWPAGVVVAAAIVGATAHVIRSGDRDLGLRSPARPDERQAANRVRALAASAGWSAMAALVGYAVTRALGQNQWLFLPYILAGAASFAVALAVTSARGHAAG